MEFEEDKVENWFHKSYKKYGELVMFESAEPIQQLQLYDMNIVCVLREFSKGNRNWISLFLLPDKITDKHFSCLKANKNGNIRDLRNLTGIIPDHPTTQILALYGKNKLLSSQLNTDGICMYTLTENQSQTGHKEMVLEQMVEVQLENPQIELLNQSQTDIIITKITSKPTILADLNTGQEISRILTTGKPGDDTGQSQLLKPLSLIENVVGLSEKFTGKTHIFDIRMKSALTLLDVSKGSVPEDEDCYWTFASSYSAMIAAPYVKRDFEKEVYFLSSSGLFKSYDMRNYSLPLIDSSVNLKTKNKFINIKPSCFESNHFSISGFDSNVYIFTKKLIPMRPVFLHDGHKICENSWSTDTIVMDNLWYSYNTLISAALNGTIQCWDGKNFSYSLIIDQFQKGSSN